MRGGSIQEHVSDNSRSNVFNDRPLNYSDTSSYHFGSDVRIGSRLHEIAIQLELEIKSVDPIHFLSESEISIPHIPNFLSYLAAFH
jgi:hypothetical protein